MSVIGKALKGVRIKGRRRDAGAASAARAQVQQTAASPPVDIAPNDPIIAYFQQATGVVDVDGLELDSPAVLALRDAGVKLVVPLVTQGELVGLINLGPRLSERDYSADDRRLLANLAAQASPALRVGQLVRQQEAEVRDRERLDQELRVAQLIQQQFLPKELPEFGGWRVSAYYRPAREVGGDFYDFIELPDGRVGIVVGDVTDKGVPAALVMATTRSILRGDAGRLLSPGKVLERANDLLVPDIPAQMFVTCLYGVLDPTTGRFEYANAGHNLPYVSTPDGVVELHARGMPLGLMPGMEYEEKETVLAPGQCVLLHSDGLAEAHAPDGDMFGFPRVLGLMKGATDAEQVVDVLLHELDRFTGEGWEQEDDITLVVLQRSLAAGHPAEEPSAEEALVEFSVPSETGNERLVMDRVMESVSGLDIEKERLERLKTAVSEAAMNAIEHGNGGRAELPVLVSVRMNDGTLSVRITDEGGAAEIPEAEVPDLEAKLAGLQKPRGWGLFLIQNMVDDMESTSDGHLHHIDLRLHLKGEN
jgi:serine phosphatase RsbU (regulator of sigma subunit)/anti-sigma regulatory factor (Ser/Thr protein kinase)